MEAAEGEPRLVPEEHEVRLDGQTLLHHPLDVVEDAVERAVGEHQHLDAIELARPLEGEQLALDLGERDRAVHRVLVERVRVEVAHLGAGQHQPVVMRLVAVPVDEHDVARADIRLADDLVRRRRAVGDEVRAARAERLRGQILGLAQRTGRLQQRVEPAAGGRRLGQEDVEAVEVDHVLDPVRAHHGLALADGQRVERPGRPVCVRTQRVEERGPVAVRDAVQDGQVQLEQSLPGVEHPAEVRAQAAGHLFDRDLGHQVDVELGPDRGELVGQDLGAFLWRALVEPLADRRVDELVEPAQVVGRRVPEPAPDDTGLEGRVHPHRDDGLLAAADHDDVVDELIVRPAPAADVLTQRPLLVGRHPLDHQHLEIALVGVTELGLLGGLDGIADQVGGRPRLGRPVGVVGAEHALDLGGGAGELDGTARAEELLDPAEPVLAGIGPVPLDVAEDLQIVGDRVGHRVGSSRIDRSHPPVGLLLDLGPEVEPGLPPCVVGLRRELGHDDLLVRLPPALAADPTPS